MSNMFEAKFNFHPIGQGCFYTGHLGLDHKSNLNFNFVYDCGTASKMEYLENKIKKIKDGLHKNTLDVLMISHFDADHVNGVSNLLTSITCKRVIIPYYNPIERLLLYTTTTNVDADYRRFLLNPVDYLNDPDRFRVEEIIIIGGPDEETGFQAEQGNNIPPNEGNLESLIARIESFDELLFSANTKAISDDEIGKKILSLERITSNIDKVKCLRKPYKVDVGLWEFFFYLKKHDNVVLINNFTRDVDDLMVANGWSVFDLFDEENVEELKKMYRSYYGQNLNNTSLVTYHGPLFNVSKIHYYGIHWMYRYWFCERKKVASLMTGDVDLNSSRKIDKMLEYYGDYINEVCVFQVPHHGSVHNLSLKHPNKLESFCSYLINHGVGRSHHPSVDVVHYLLTHTNGHVILNNEANSFKYGFRFFP